MSEGFNKKRNQVLRSGVLVTGAAATMFGCGYLMRGADVTAQTTTQTPVVSTTATRDAVAIQNAFAQVSNAIEPAVVTITTRRTASTASRPRVSPFPGAPGEDGNDPFEEFFRRFERDGGMQPNSYQRDEMKNYLRQVQNDRGGGGLGSGMIFRADGYILTNAHVVNGASANGITVKMADEREFKNARLIGLDERTDVAVLKINANNLPTVKFGDSGDVRVGDWAIAVGNPFGLEHTVTVGVISAKAREVPLNVRRQGYPW
jgi:serine protease Do